MYLLLRMIFCPEDDGTSREVSKIQKTHIMSIAQDIIFTSSNGKKLTPKHIGLALSVHQATRSKSLIQLLNSSGHCIGYDKLQRVTTSIAQHQVDLFEQNGNLFIPENINPSRFLQFAADNIDIIEETLDGKGTFHGTQMAIFQRGPSSDVEHPGTIFSNDRVLKSLPNQYNKLVPSNFTKNDKPIVRFKEPANVKDYVKQYSSSQLYFRNALDFVWLLSRFYSRNADEHSIPAWTSFNQAVDETDVEVSVTGYLPIIPSPATEYDTVWTVLKQCMAITQHFQLANTVITFDEGLYHKARTLAWQYHQECQNLVLRLGGFHIMMNF